MKHFCSFSEAIREGAKIRPQATQLFEVLPLGVIGSCAVGAGYEAITGETTAMFCYGVYETVKALYPYLESPSELSCPVPECGEDELMGLAEGILHLNDCHYWSREQIADWLEREEEKLGFITLVESESSSESLPAAAVLSV